MLWTNNPTSKLLVAVCSLLQLSVKNELISDLNEISLSLLNEGKTVYLTAI